MGLSRAIWLVSVAFFLGISALCAQNFEVLPLSESLIGNPGQAIKIPIQIKNQSEKAQFYIIRLAESDLKAGQKGYFCFNGDCLSEESFEVSKKIEGFSTLTGLYYMVETGLSTGLSQLRFEVFVKGSNQTLLDWPVSIMVDEKQPKNVVFKSKDIMVRELYPNPVTATAYLDYELYSEKKSAKIMIHNILGTSMGEQELSFNETKAKILTEELTPGIYFYTIYLDGEGIITRKMVVRR